MWQSFFLCIFLMSTVICSHAALSPTREDDDTATTRSYNDDCLTNSLEKSLFCRGSRAIRNVINNLNKSEKPIVIVRGLEIVRSRDANANVTEENAKVASGNENAVDESFLGRFSEYLRSHELNIKFSDLLAEESERFLARDLERNGVKTDTAGDVNGTGYVEEARKKDKGQGILMAMALMFGKMMAVMGLGGIGALAMKALGVAMAALMMAGIVGLKSLAQHGGGHEKTHSVQYVTADGHAHRRRRRDLTLPNQMYANQKFNKVKNYLEMVYRGWQPKKLTAGTTQDIRR